MVLGYTFGGQLERAAAYNAGLPTIACAILIVATAALITLRLVRNHRWLISLQAGKGLPARHKETKAQEARAVGT